MLDDRVVYLSIDSHLVIARDDASVWVQDSLIDEVVLVVPYHCPLVLFPAEARVACVWS